MRSAYFVTCTGCVKDDDGNVVAYESDGKTKKFGASGTVLSITEYVNASAKDKDYAHLFQSSSGGGSAGGGAAGTKTTGNPFKIGPSFNLTAQAQIMRDAPTQAAQLKLEAAS